MPWLISFTLLVMAPPAVQVELVDGKLVTGQLQQLSLQEIVLASGDQTISIPGTQVRWLRLSEQPAPTPGRAVWLRDGSRIAMKDFHLERAQATITDTDGKLIAVPAGQIKHVLLQDLGGNETLVRQWNEILAKPPAKDLLVYRAERNGTVALDVLEGVVHRVDEQVVEFEFEGDRIEPKRERIVGLVFYSAQASRGPALAARVLLKDGSSWSVEHLERKEDRLEWVSIGGLRASAEWEQLAAIDYASGHSLYLSDLPVEAAQWRTFIPSKLPDELLAPLRAPRFNETFDGGPIRLAGRTWYKGLALHSYNEVTYRLPEGYRYFRATIGTDEQRVENATGSVECRVVLDGKVVWQQNFAVPGQVTQVEIPLGGARRLTIVADYGAGGDAGDYLYVTDARLTQ
ncbi:MAG: hypothetical protein KatS3mg110_4085 [Pirellulaceae bacterium]|nr:MAG: hypothetical protein KatS3mg110_4085 [Pirellulaceae bacterium]